MALERGTRLGPYQIESPIGARGMGEVPTEPAIPSSGVTSPSNPLHVARVNQRQRLCRPGLQSLRRDFDERAEQVVESALAEQLDGVQALPPLR